MSGTVQQWLDWAKSQVPGIDYHIISPGDKMELASEEEVQASPVYWLQHYAAWMAYFSGMHYVWRSVYKLLDNECDNRLNQAVALGRGARGSSAAAKVQLVHLLNAKVQAEMLYDKAYAQVKTAETYRDMVSRAVAVMEKERQVTRQW